MNNYQEWKSIENCICAFEYMVKNSANPEVYLNLIAEGQKSFVTLKERLDPKEIIKSEIFNRKYALQLIDFKSLRWGMKLPTDIDALMEVWDKLFVFIEAKHKGASMRLGQRLAFERVVDALGETGRFAYLVIAEHDVADDQDIDLGNTLVTKYRKDRTWHDLTEPVTVRQQVEEMAKWANINLLA